MKRLQLTADTVGPVGRGHPWVYANGVEGRAETGTPVQLLDQRGRPVAWGIADEGPIAVRVLGRHAEPVPSLLLKRIEHAVRLRQKIIRKDTNAFRLINGAGDGLPGLIIDRYDEVLVIRLYSRAWLPHMSALLDALREKAQARTILRKFGVRNVDGGKPGADLLSGEALPSRLIVRENGLLFRVRPVEGQKTGLFLDQRENRAFLGNQARDLQVTNLFAYNGGFSVYAAAGGARRVLSVDIAPAALEDAKENFRLNGLNPDSHGFLVTDVFEWKPSGAPPDLLICDPPSLSRGKRSDGAARQAYRDLATRCGGFVESQGMLATFSCTARLDTQRWMLAIREGLRRAGRWSLLWQAYEPADHPVALEHPEARYLKFGLFRRA
jgi:23S rRNA (cytosine1962-C5)-methyltransferase